MIIKNADVLCIIGSERDSTKDKAHHILTLHIIAKNINPKDFIGLYGKKDLEIKII